MKGKAARQGCAAILPHVRCERIPPRQARPAEGDPAEKQRRYSLGNQNYSCSDPFQCFIERFRGAWAAPRRAARGYRRSSAYPYPPCEWRCRLLGKPAPAAALCIDRACRRRSCGSRRRPQAAVVWPKVSNPVGRLGRPARRVVASWCGWRHCGANVSVQQTRLENGDGVGDDGVHQGFKWTPWNTPGASVGGATIAN